MIDKIAESASWTKSTKYEITASRPLIPNPLLISSFPSLINDVPSEKLDYRFFVSLFPDEGYGLSRVFASRLFGMAHAPSSISFSLPSSLTVGRNMTE